MHALFFDRPDVELRTIHRQAEGSAIIRQSQNIIRMGRYEADGTGVRVVNAKAVGDEFQVDDELLLHADVRLCWTNATKFSLNQHIRRLLGFTGHYPQEGETVPCLQNSLPHGLFNGASYTMAHDFRDDDAGASLEIEGHRTLVPRVCFWNSPRPYSGNAGRKYTSAFEFGYTLTAHKSQGSEFPSVLLIDEYRGADRTRWLYTAVTRAAERVTIIRIPG